MLYDAMMMAVSVIIGGGAVCAIVAALDILE